MSVVRKQKSRSVRLTPEEDTVLQRVSHVERLPETALLHKFVLDGLAHYRLEHACRAYARGEVNLSQAARYADVSVEEVMHELEQRGIDYGPTTEQFLDGLETLAAEFDAPELGQVVADLRERPELWEAGGSASPAGATEHPF